MIKKLFNYIRKLYYRRLYKKLVFAYLKHKKSTNINVAEYADITFHSITGYYYDDFKN